MSNIKIDLAKAYRLNRGQACFLIKLTIANAKRVSVNSGPNETIIRKMEEETRHFIANGVGKVMTIAAETRRKAHKSPEM